MPTPFQMDDRKKAHHKWVFNLYTAFQENSIHCPECIRQQKIGYEWTRDMFETKGALTPLEEQELKFDRLKIVFLNFLYKKLCKRVAEEQEADLQARLAANRAGRPLLVIPAAPAVAASSNVAAATVEEDYYC